MKKLALKMIDMWCAIFMYPILFFGGFISRKTNFVEKILSRICRVVEKTQGLFCSFYLRNIYSSNNFTNRKIQSHDTIAVIMQGPILVKNNFTLETIKMYQNYGDNIKIILSTWLDEDMAYIKEIEKLGVSIVLSEKPLCSGTLNLNYQLISFQAGIRKAIELECSLICKTRTDQRLYSAGGFNMMKNLIKTYKPNNTKLSGRIVALPTSIGSLYMSYYLSDFLYMGKTEDMVGFLKIPLDWRDGSIVEGKTMIDVLQGQLIPEIYIIRKFIEIATYDPRYDETVKGYWEFVKDCLIIVDRAMIGLYWPKYEYRYYEHIGHGILVGEKNSDIIENFDFATWLCLIGNELKYNEGLEKYMKRIL